MLKLILLGLFLALELVCRTHAILGGTIANKANSYIGSTKWSYASSHSVGRNKNKCNIFISDVMKKVGGSVPQRRWLWDSPIGAEEWANRRSTYLTKDRCWKNVNSPTIGDVMAGEGHVAFYTGWRTTTSAAYSKVVQNNWGFRPASYRGGGKITGRYAYWRYTC